MCDGYYMYLTASYDPSEEEVTAKTSQQRKNYYHFWLRVCIMRRRVEGWSIFWRESHCVCVTVELVSSVYMQNCPAL